jgi:hypothetical protein
MTVVSNLLITSWVITNRKIVFANHRDITRYANVTIILKRHNSLLVEMIIMILE